jgi:prevent-host-death family protein
MRTVNIAELKNRLSTYLNYARAGEEVIIRDRKTPVAKLVPFVDDGLSEETRELLALGYMRLPEKPFDIDAFLKLPRPTVSGNAGAQAVLDERDEDGR